MAIKIRLVEQGKERIAIAEASDNLLEVLQRENTSIHAPCGGRGTCKKCIVEVEGLGKVLACRTDVGEIASVNEDEIKTVTLPEKSKAVILSEGQMTEYNLNPVVKIKSEKLKPPSVDDQTPDEERITRQTGAQVPFHVLACIPDILRKNDFSFTYSCRTDISQITSVYGEYGIDKNNMHGMAVDIGTTTIAGFLYNLKTGERIASASCLNSQKKYGADVISRIDYVSKSQENADEMQRLLYNDILDIAFELSKKVEDIKLISFSGNTTMMHLLCGINPEAIAKSPYIPVFISSKICYFDEIFEYIDKKLKFNPVCIMLPSIAGYVGADITAGILSCEMDKNDSTKLLIDIGTNGEIALSRNGRITTCSVAAGPAFEGANIECGTGGVSGAIDKVVIKNGDIEYSTISDESANGICGSGIVSAIASLLKVNVIDETGRFVDEPDELSEKLQKSLFETENGSCFVFLFDKDNAPSVYITQKDIREIQNAKAAIHAGIVYLIEKEGLTYNDIDEVCIAGGFGNYLNIDDAVRIGIIPGQLKPKTVMKGNTSIIGASLCLLDSDMVERCEKIRNSVNYHELSADKRFTELYVDSMMFE